MVQVLIYIDIVHVPSISNMTGLCMINIINNVSSKKQKT